MADSREEIAEMIRARLQRAEPPDTKALYGRAVHIEESVQDLTLRQFNAKYVLQVKRKMKTDEEPEQERKEEPESAGQTRARVREILLQFARDVAAADRAEMIEVFTSVDVYVDKVVEALEL